ncbi:Esterase [Lentibacillus sp. JNUCC-1]|uniref:alpha/beta fold hydrolase n=1 Tax=Lentibacillus sp. JNUCC-1 TaxID=2654513 RepID=UPI0012E8B137|nr:alpha/beta fold hydrolase [Lentibacillus sp. JNUCC-1]MUV36535.1 Esterase [Lentibacillus sp. JNUCC-1]
MIGVFSESIKGIPSLIVVQADRQNEPLPVFIYYHGFTSAKEHNLPLAYILAEKGYRVILPDSLYHGNRAEGLDMEQMQLSFWDVVFENISDVKTIYDWLSDSELVLEGRIGIGGTSMGGMTTTAALTQYPWIKTAAVMMGTPKLTEYADMLVDQYQRTSGKAINQETIKNVYSKLTKIDLSRHMEKLNDRPVFFWHGDKDPVVPFEQSHSFYKEAVKQYKHTDRIYFLKEKDRDHKVSRFAMLAAVKWVENHL